MFSIPQSLRVTVLLGPWSVSSYYLANPFSENGLALESRLVIADDSVPAVTSVYPSSVCSAPCWENYGWNVLTFWKQEECCSVTQLCSLSSGWWISHSSFPRRKTLGSWSQPTTHSRLPIPVTSTFSTLSPKRYHICACKSKELWEKTNFRFQSDPVLEAPELVGLRQ